MYIALDLTGSGKLYAANRPLVLEEPEAEGKKETAKPADREKPRGHDVCASGANDVLPPVK
ncbi:MAG: hypothetical protein II771_05470 [Clostridia bacterium]|nr:hypothetical protein [Clostridia bacterium]